MCSFWNGCALTTGKKTNLKCIELVIDISNGSNLIVWEGQETLQSKFLLTVCDEKKGRIL